MSCYNAEKTVAAAVESVLRQTHQDFEFLITDDNSNDNTVDAIAEFNDPRIKLVLSNENRGLTAQLISLVELANGEFIARIDADDVWLPNKLHLQLQALTSANPRSVMFGEMSNGRSAQRNTGTDRPGIYEVSYDQLLKEGNSLCHSSFIGKKSLIQAVGGYRRGLRRKQDFDLWLRMSKAGIDLLVVSEAVVVRGHHNLSLSNMVQIVSR